MSDGTLLVVEDDFLIRMTLVEALQDEGFTIVEAGNTDEAITLAEADGALFNILVTDIQLPGSVDGWDLAKYLRRDRPALPVIYMTGRPDPDMELDPVLDRCVPKPYLPSDICNAVRAMLKQPDAGR